MKVALGGHCGAGLSPGVHISLTFVGVIWAPAAATSQTWAPLGLCPDDVIHPSDFGYRCKAQGLGDARQCGTCRHQVELPEAQDPWGLHLRTGPVSGSHTCSTADTRPSLLALDVLWGGQEEVGFLAFCKVVLFQYQTNQSRRDDKLMSPLTENPKYLAPASGAANRVGSGTPGPPTRCPAQMGPLL